MRGPFNIRERMELPSSIQAEKSIQNSMAHNVLLNPNSSDGCWDVLFMICGGTGITPIIQLVINLYFLFFLNYYTSNKSLGNQQFLAQTWLSLENSAFSKVYYS